MAEVPPRTPLGELTALPRPLAGLREEEEDKEGELGKEGRKRARKGGEGREGKEGGEGRGEREGEGVGPNQVSREIVAPGNNNNTSSSSSSSSSSSNKYLACSAVYFTAKVEKSPYYGRI